MRVTGVCQSVALALKGQSLYSEAMGTNFSDAGQRESSRERCPFESLALVWRDGKKQFIILSTGQRQVHWIECSRGGIGAAGRRYGECAEIHLHPDMAFLADVAKVSGEAV